jgi:hypothetical protein
MTQPSAPTPRGTAARRAQRATDDSRTETVGSAPTGSARAPRTTRRQLDPDVLAALEEERDFLLDSLADLEREHDADDVDDADYESLKDAYTSRAADVLRAIDDRHELIDASRTPRAWGRTLVTLVIVGVLAMGAGWVVFRNAGTRAPGQGLTGDARQDSANLILQAQSATGQASAALQAGDGAKALKYFEMSANSSNPFPMALHAIGNHYLYGEDEVGRWMGKWAHGHAELLSFF